MTYFSTGARSEIVFDNKRFLADISSALGGTDIDPDYQGGRFIVGELAIYLHVGYGAKAKRVTVNSGIADRKAHALAYARRSNYNFPEITIDPDRPLDALAKDIRKRVIEAAATPIAEMKAAADAQANNYASLKASADRLNAKHPGIVTMPADETKIEASLYVNGGGVYLSGRLNCYGGIYVERLGSVPAGKVDALIALLAS